MKKLVKTILRYSEDQRNKLKKIADAKKNSINDTILFAIDEYIDRNKKK